MRQTKTHDDSPILDRARLALRSVADLMTEAGVRVKPWQDESLPLLCGLEPLKFTKAMLDIESRAEFLQAAKRDGLKLTDSPQLLWRTLRASGWLPQGDVFDYIADEDTVEVYNLDQVQTFRNLQFFRYVSFTLEQMHTQPWYVLSKRGPEAEAALAREVTKIISGQVTSTISLEHIPEHLAWEVGSEESRQFMIRLRCLSPLTEDGKLVAIVAVNRTSPPVEAS